MLLAVAERILQTKPFTIVECSSGVSTVVAARCCQLVGHGHVFSLEHEAEYAEKTRQQLVKHGLEQWATVFHSPLVSVGDGRRWYSDDVLPADLPPTSQREPAVALPGLSASEIQDGRRSHAAAGRCRPA
jgi:tRNA A58 N-methylase Trm61